MFFSLKGKDHIELREPVEADYPEYLNLRNNQEIQRQILNAHFSLQTLEQTKSWLKKKEINPTIYFASIIYSKNNARECIGYIQLSFHETDTFYVGLAIIPQKQHCGIGKITLALIDSFTQSRERTKLYAEVAPDNIASQRLFTSCGYILEDGEISTEKNSYVFSKEINKPQHTPNKGH